MFTFTLAISCLTTSNLPWFIDLTFQVPMQYCSLHRTLLLSSVTSTTGCCFPFGSVSSFFLELFLCSSPVANWTSTNLEDTSSGVIFFCLSWGSRGKKQEWFAIPFFSRSCFVRCVYVFFYLSMFSSLGRQGGMDEVQSRMLSKHVGQALVFKRYWVPCQSFVNLLFLFWFYQDIEQCPLQCRSFVVWINVWLLFFLCFYNAV